MVLKVFAKSHAAGTVHGEIASQPAASNKTNPPEHQIAYCVELPTTDVVTVTKPIIDKLAFVGSFADVDAAPVLKGALLDAVKDEKSPYKNAPKASVGQKRYKVNVHLHHAASNQAILIQVDPGSPKVAFARFEFNPAKLGPSGMEFLRTELSDLLMHQVPWSQFATQARVTRIDLACDLVNVGVEALAFSTSVLGKSHVYFGMKGAVQTAYLAVKKGKSGKITAYNKKRQLKDTGKDPQYGDLAHTRIEVRLATKYPMNQLAKLQNPFAKIDLRYLAPTADGIEDHIWAHFTDAVRYRGVTAALALIPSGLRPPYEAGLNALASPLWRPADIWGTWPSVLHATKIAED